MSREIVIIGGGASGLTAAIGAARHGARVTVLERNEKPGRKLLATGNGKCNLTNRDGDLSHFHSEDADRVAAVTGRFGPRETLALFEELGLSVFDRDGWVYPVTEQAGSVLQLLLLEADRLGIKRKNNEQVLSVEREAERFLVRTAGWSYKADAVIVATGSPASAVRGASADALGIASSFGIRTKAFLPALVPLLSPDPRCAAWAGVRARARAELFTDGERVSAETGEVQFTSRGVSGIPIMQFSHLAAAAADQGKSCRVILDLHPYTGEDVWNERIAGILRHDPAKTRNQALIGLLPEKLIPLVSDSAKLEIPVKGAADLTQAQVCSGGVLLSELSDTLESRTQPGLYFAGECTDVHGDCGGYNLQWAWSSGFVAGQAAAGGMG